MTRRRRHGVAHLTPPVVHKCRPHEIHDLHWARKDEVVSWLICECGLRLEECLRPDDAQARSFSHARLEAAYGQHRREAQQPVVYLSSNGRGLVAAHQ